MEPQELIGAEVEVVEAANPSLRGLAGRVVDETMRTLLVEAARGERPRRVPKAGCRFRFRWPGGRTVEMDGRGLVGRPEESRVYIRPEG
ncbi:MAG: ribonuclease P protein subunit [Halobacteria archaeon]